VAGVAFVLGVLALLPLRGRPRALRVAPSTLGRAAVALVGALLVVSSSCTRANGPVPLAYGKADCDVCRMRITDQRYGGEVVTRRGKVQQFDSIECLASYVAASDSASGPISVYVSDFDQPGHLLPVSSALFVRRGGSGSPMGAGLLAVGARQDTAVVRVRFGGALLTWSQVRALAASGALRPAHDSPASGQAS
jgi:copper chaperone NosL